MPHLQNFSRVETNIENATEIGQNGGEQAGTMLLMAAVIMLLIAAVFQLIVCCGTQECHSSFLLCSVPPRVISSLVAECCTMIGSHSTMHCNKVIPGI